MHQINNLLPILQDPRNKKRSLLWEAEGAIEEIKAIRWGQLGDLLDELPLKRRTDIKKKIIEEMKCWLELNEYHPKEYAQKLNNLFQVKIPRKGPPRGRSVFAKRDIEQFEVIGPYAGALHLTNESLERSIRSQGRKNILTYLFETRASCRSIDAFKRGSTISLINTAAMPHQRPWSKNNITAIQFGKNLTFYIANIRIPKGKELLIDYGETYDPDDPD